MVRLRPVPLVVFCGGFAASALEVVLLLAFQVLFGSLYYQVGLIVTMFMLGLVIGAMVIGRWLVGWDAAAADVSGGCGCGFRRVFAAGTARAGDDPKDRRRWRRAKWRFRC